MVLLVIQGFNGDAMMMCRDYKGHIPIPGDFVLLRLGNGNMMVRVASRVIDVLGGAIIGEDPDKVYDSHVYLTVMNPNHSVLVVPSNQGPIVSLRDKKK